MDSILCCLIAVAAAGFVEQVVVVADSGSQVVSFCNL